MLAAFSPKAEGQVYNVATGCETTVNTLARMIREITCSQVEIKSIDRRDIDNIRRRVLNIEKIRRELRWIPSVTLETGLTHTYKWLIGSGYR